MPYTSLFFHLVWSTKHRLPQLNAQLRSELFPIMGGILNDLKAHPDTMNGVDDHVHLLVKIPTTVTIADLVRHLKGDSSRKLNDNAGKQVLKWQEKYGAFTVSPGDVERVRAYIRNQDHHHQKTTFQAEFLGILNDLGIAYDERYLWD